MNVRTLVAVGAAFWSAAPAGADPPQAAWREALPAGWLVAVEVADLARVERAVARLSEPWGVKPPALAARVAELAPEVPLRGAWGFALATDAAGSVAPVLYVPADDFDGLCRALDAERAGEVAVATLSGFEVALVERGAWVEAALLEGRPVSTGKRSEPRPWRLEGDLRIVASPAGLARAAETLAHRRRGQIEVGAGRVLPWRWPEALAGYADRLALYHPLARELAAWGAPLEAAFSLPDDALVARIALDLGPDPTVIANAARPLAERGDQIGAASLAGPLPERLVNLGLAYLACRPDEIDAAAYPQPQWDDYADACRRLLARQTGAECVLTLPAEDAPLATNHAVAFRWDGPDAELGDALRLVTLRWNQLVDASPAASPLRVTMAPLDDGRGWRLASDLFEGFALERSPEVEAVFERYYGSDVYAVEVRREANGRWLATHAGSDAPAPEPRRDADATEAAAPPEGRLAVGAFRVDRWIAWQRRIEDFDMADAIGHRPRPPMADAPAATLSIARDDVLRVEATLPWPTYEAAVKWRRSTARDGSER